MNKNIKDTIIEVLEMELSLLEHQENDKRKVDIEKAMAYMGEIEPETEVKPVEASHVYTIGVFENQSGYVRVKAKNQKEATKMVEEKLDEVGVGGFYDYNNEHREVGLSFIDKLR